MQQQFRNGTAPEPWITSEPSRAKADQDGQDEELTVVSRLEKAESWRHDVMAVTGHVFTRLGLSAIH